MILYRMEYTTQYEVFIKCMLILSVLYVEPQRFIGVLFTDVPLMILQPLKIVQTIYDNSRSLTGCFPVVKNNCFSMKE